MITGIRARLLAVIALATLVPLAVAILAVQTIGYRHLVKERGTAFQGGAAHLAGSLRGLAQAEINQLREYLSHDWLLSFCQEANQKLKGRTGQEWLQHGQEMDARWPMLQTNSAELGALLENSLARDLRAFRARHPLCAEMLVTDRAGGLIASTGKTSDYWQADEDWWQRAVRVKPGQVWLEGLLFDESSATFAMDVSIPIRAADGQVAGVLKASLNASPMFSSVLPVLPDSHLKRFVARGDGAVLVRLLEPGFQPESEHLQARALEHLKAKPEGWMVGPLLSEEHSLSGFARLRVGEGGDLAGKVGLVPMYVVVYEPATAALAGLRRQVTLLTISGGALVLVFGAAGLWLATHRIIVPVALLQTAADSVARTVERAEIPEGDTGREASERLAELEQVRTGDELETLARNFQVMGRRVLRYQQQLEEDIAAKTATIQRDLDMARDFQTALMPSRYPEVPERQEADRVALSFQHLYRPASTVGGDFFDVLKLSPHRAGVFIADVMGHGARSALVTAILRTLLQTHANELQDPAVLLSAVNREFQELTERTQQTMFVTALYMVFDTLEQRFTCASAGHPAPLVASRNTGAVTPLYAGLKGNPALGLLPAARYEQHQRSLQAGDVVLLYTDGVVEAANASGAEFGLEGLTRAMRANLGADGRLIHAISMELTAFLDGGGFEDDVCLVTIDVLEREAGREPPSAAIV